VQDACNIRCPASRTGVRDEPKSGEVGDICSYALHLARACEMSLCPTQTDVSVFSPASRTGVRDEPKTSRNTDEPERRILMASLNKKTKLPPVTTYEGAPAVRINAEKQLRRSLMSCLLWESEFYESGTSIAERLSDLIKKVDAEKVASMMIEARSQMYLRHAPLLIATELARIGKLKANDLTTIIQRADELSEFLSIYWKDGKCKLSNQVKKGLAKAFEKFDAYALAKYNRNKDIKLRNVMFLTHPKPKNKEQAAIFKKLANNELESPDTWEVELSTGKGLNKKESWIRLLKENKINGLALIRNLRNMQQAGVDKNLIRQSIINMKTDKILPFRFIAAAKYAPQLESELEQAMFKCLSTFEKLPGKTALVIDTSPSMWGVKISAKSELDRFEAASALAILAREICEDVTIYAFNEKGYVIPARRGFALRDALAKTKGCASYGGLAVLMANKDGYDRIIVLTDGEWHNHRRKSSCTWNVHMGKAEKIADLPKTDKAYMLNVASYQYGVGYGKWTSIDGFSENVLRYIAECERSAP